ncbi:MAG: ATP-grasp domain-containing protein [Rubrobacter sp.]|nr:ATP-grasp domain-containing protein [Rubrobacter sp.]
MEDKQPHRLGYKKQRGVTLPPKLTPVLLAADDYYSILAAVRALRAIGYAPWLAVDQLGTYAARSRATAGTVSVPDPSFDSEGFVRELAAAATRLSVAAVLPSAEIHLPILAGRDDDFPGVALGVPSSKSVERATDKGMLPELAAAAGLRIPPTAKVIHGEDETLDTFGFPAIVKPLRSRIRNPDGTISALSARYVSSEQAAREAIKALPDGEGLVQRYTPGRLTSVSGVSWEGALVCALHQVSVRIWPEPAGVSSYAETVPPNLELEQGLSRLLQSIGWSGLFQAQFIRDSDGKHYLIDLNPRIYGSLALAVAAGLNLPVIWVDLLLGRRPEVRGYRVGVRFRHESKDVRALARMLVKGGERRQALRGFVPQRDTTHAIFSLRDPMPLLAIPGRLVERLKRYSVGGVPSR